MMIEYRKIAWWYWLGTVLLIGTGLAGHTGALFANILLCCIQIAHYLVITRHPASFPVQVRTVFLVVLLIPLWEPLRWLYWIPLVGVSARVLFGYCFLARTLALMPWNRREPLSPSLVRKTYFFPPVKGNIIQGLT